MTSAAYAICREARQRARLSQRAVAARARVSPSTVARIERGRMEPTFELLTRLVEACGQELRIRITEIDWAGRSDWSDMSFEDRLRAVHSATQFAAPPMTEWTATPRPLDAARLFTVLHAHDVASVVVGGLAAIAHGYTGLTQDADTVPDYDVANLDRLARALAELNAELYAFPSRTDLHADGSPPELDGFELTGRHLCTRRVWQFMTDAGPLDVHLIVDGPGGYDVLIRNAEPRSIGDFTVMVASLEDLIEAKETAGRDKDLRALGELQRLQERKDGR